MQFTIGLLQFCKNLSGFGLEGLELDRGLFGGFCDVTKVGNHLENNLAKLGYIRDLKYAAKHI